MTRQFFTSAIIASVALTACGGTTVQRGASVGTKAESAVTEAATATTAAKPAMTEAAPATTEAATPPSQAAVPTTEAAPPTTAAPAPSGAMNINTDGPGVCIDKVLAHLGPDAMVNEIESFFETGDDIDPPSIADDEPPVPGDLFICKAYYQDPENPIKLLAIEMDTDTGEFDEPGPVEITVTGDAADFDLNDYVMKASDVNTAVIQPVMDEKTAFLNEKFSLWRWNRVSLTAPGAFNDVHVWDLRMEGRLASNDITDSGYITVGIDGAVIDDYLD